MKIRIDINNDLLVLVNKSRDTLGFTTSQMINHIIDYYYINVIGQDYMKKVIDESKKQF